MTATPILETLSREFSARVEHVQNALEMIDAGLSAPFIGRFRRAQIGGLSESMVRRLERSRQELEELDRRRGTILRLLEREPGIGESTLAAIHACMDRFELEDLFIPHRRPEPEVQLALDRGLGQLADLLVAPLPKAERASLLGTATESEENEGDEDEEADSSNASDASNDAAASEARTASDHVVASTSSASAEASANVAPASTEAALALEVSESATEPAPMASDDSTEEHEEESNAAAPTLDAPMVSHAHVDPRTVMNAQLARLCQGFVRPDKGIHTEAEALSGALRILSDRLGRDARLRGSVRHLLAKHGVLSVRPTVDESRVGRHRSLLKTRQPLRQLQGHRLLAIRQAQKERALNTVITIDPARVLPKVRSALGRHTHPAHAEVLNEVAQQALNYRLLPMVEQDVRLELKERADAEALRFLAQHLRQILFTPPLGLVPVAGIDVNAKGDWTVVVIDANGEPQGPDVRIEVGEKDAATLGAELVALLAPLQVKNIAVGHGKGPRAAVNKLRAASRAVQSNAFVFIVDEAGLSSYANSELARNELPDRNVPARMAISLARRLQDPLWEILKVDPRHLGLGTEQGLVSKANAKRVFVETIESCAAHVGCDVNRAPLAFLEHLPGIDRETAKKIVARRAEKPIASREDLRVEGLLTEAQWTSAIAFLRVQGSAEPLDATGLHPEQYPIVRRLLDSAGTSVEQGFGRPGTTKGLRRGDFDIDEATWRDLMREIAFPGRDPRMRLHAPALLEPDTDPVRLVKDRVVEGIVSNVASFGTFVDVGLPQDAMIHISEISDRYVRDARELLSIGQALRARIVDASGQRLSLSLKNVPAQVREGRPDRDRPRFDRSRGRVGEPRTEGQAQPREGGGGDRGRGRPGRGRDREEPKAQPNVRAAQTRRDGLGGRGGGGTRRGPGGQKRGGPRRPGEGEDRGERVRLDTINTGAKPAFSPFASFFKGKKEGEKA